ncbi:MAG TPA: hypothetical protein VGD78_04900 [Chthoniobacterales bacterium]
MKQSGDRRGWAWSGVLLAMGLAGVFGLWAPAVAAWAQEDPKPSAEASVEGAVELRGAMPDARRLSFAELQHLPRTEVRTKDAHDGARETLYGGVLLAEVLKAGGLSFEPGMATARENARASLLVEAADGYRAVFALAELDPTLTSGLVLLADTRDGRPLDSVEGPWRIVVASDKRPTRWVRRVTALTVRRD